MFWGAIIQSGGGKGCKNFPSYSWELLGPIIQSPGHVSMRRPSCDIEPKLESQCKSKGKQNNIAAAI